MDKTLYKDVYVFAEQREGVIQPVALELLGKAHDLAPKLAARLCTGLTADCTKLEISEETRDLMMTRPAFGGNLMATIMSPETRPQMSTVRPGVMQKAAPQPGQQGVVERFKPVFDPSRFKVRLLENVKINKGAVDISEAKILVSGGRGGLQGRLRKAPRPCRHPRRRGFVFKVDGRCRHHGS